MWRHWLGSFVNTCSLLNTFLVNLAVLDIDVNSISACFVVIYKNPHFNWIWPLIMLVMLLNCCRWNWCSTSILVCLAIFFATLKWNDRNSASVQALRRFGCSCITTIQSSSTSYTCSQLTGYCYVLCDLLFIITAFVMHLFSVIEYALHTGTGIVIINYIFDKFTAVNITYFVHECNITDAIFLRVISFISAILLVYVIWDILNNLLLVRIKINWILIFEYSLFFSGLFLRLIM